MGRTWRRQPEARRFQRRQSGCRMATESALAWGEPCGLGTPPQAAAAPTPAAYQPPKLSPTEAMSPTTASVWSKAASALVAQRLWPGVDWRASARCSKPHDGLTDAACIAEWGRRRF